MDQRQDRRMYRGIIIQLFATTVPVIMSLECTDKVVTEHSGDFLDATK